MRYSVANISKPSLIIWTRVNDRVLRRYSSGGTLWYMSPFTLASEDVSIFLCCTVSLSEIPEVYSNSLLATLNARQAIRELGEDSENMSFSLQPTFSKPGTSGRFNSNVSFHFHRCYSSADSQLQRTTNISIKIDTTQQYTHDPTRQEPEVRLQ